MTGETPREALVRELREELGIAITVPDEPEFARLVAPDFDCRMWVITEWVGTPSNMTPHEHDDVAWWSSPEIGGLRLAHEAYPELIRRALTESPAPRCSERSQLPGPVDLQEPGLSREPLARAVYLARVGYVLQPRRAVGERPAPAADRHPPVRFGSMVCIELRPNV
jgi:hypothetical protein